MNKYRNLQKWILLVTLIMERSLVITIERTLAMKKVGTRQIMQERLATLEKENLLEKVTSACLPEHHKLVFYEK